jgi:hypothetical protein
MIFLGESITWLHAVGAVFLMGGMLIAVNARHKEVVMEKLLAAEREREQLELAAAASGASNSAAGAAAADGSAPLAPESVIVQTSENERESAQQPVLPAHHISSEKQTA